MHISGMQTKFLFSFPVFVQMSMLNWCRKEQWSYSVRKASGSWNLFLTHLYSTCWTWIPRGDAKDVLVGENKSPNMLFFVEGNVWWESADSEWMNSLLPPILKNLKKTFEPWDFILPTFVFLCLKSVIL